MKRKILFGFAVLAIAAMAAWNANFGLQNPKLSDVMLANVEALADCEDGIIVTENGFVATYCNKITEPEDEDEGKYCFTDSPDNHCVVSIDV